MSFWKFESVVNFHEVEALQFHLPALLPKLLKQQHKQVGKNAIEL